MYIELKRQDVQCYRGTTYDDSITLQNENKEPVSLSSGDKIIYGIKPRYSDTCILEKVLTLRLNTLIIIRFMAYPFIQLMYVFNPHNKEKARG